MNRGEILMRDKILIGILSGCVILSATGCSSDKNNTSQSGNEKEVVALPEQNQEEETQETETQETVQESPDYYTELIAAARECIVNKDEEIAAAYDFSSALLTTGDYETLGYMIEDIDGNGIEELIFGANGTAPDDTWDSIIYNAYTISDEGLVPVLYGWERNRYYICENGMIANESLGGASNFNTSFFTIEDSKFYLVESVIYDSSKDSTNPWFYSTVSEDDAENAEPISEEKATEIIERYDYRELTLIPFTEGN